MSREAPGWWHEPKVAWPATLLQPAALVYGAVAAHRLKRPPAYVSRLPVVCVGNFVVGGSGKTPVALALAHRLIERGRAPIFLTRGYGGRTPGPHLVDPARDSARDVGDEPLLLAARCPTVVARDRPAGARFIEGLAPATAVIVMDDGLQNPSLAKSLRLALVDRSAGLGNGRVVPAGPLRAPLLAQLDHVDAIVMTGAAPAPNSTGGDAETWLKSVFKGPVIGSQTVPVDLPAGLAGLAGRKLHAFAGIANPGRFFDMLAAAGLDVGARTAFPDHHPLSVAEAEALLEASRRDHSLLVTTEKDAARLAPDDTALGRLKAEARVFRIDVRFPPDDLQRLDALIAGAIGPRPA